MGNSTLHAITIEQLRYSNPSFYQEYCQLVEGISRQIRALAKGRDEHLDFTSFTEGYDRASHEPVLKSSLAPIEMNFIYTSISIKCTAL